MNQSGPFGSETYSGGVNGGPATKLTTTLSEPLQAAANSDMSTAELMAKYANGQASDLSSQGYHLPNQYAVGNNPGYDANVSGFGGGNAPFDPATSYAGGIGQFNQQEQQAFMGIMKGLREKGGKVATEKVGELRPRPTGKPTAK